MKRTGGKSARARSLPELAKDAHKGVAGRVFCLCGSRLYPGAAALVARAAQRAGAGLVTLGCLDELLLSVVPVSAPEAVYLDLSGPADVDAEHLGRVLSERDDHVLVVGPGLGRSERAQRLVLGLIELGLDKPLVLDADGLNALSGEPERLRGWRGPKVITPHPGEASRLLGREVTGERVARENAARELAELAGAIVCLKGHRTVVTDGRGSRENETGNAGMATAGTGDVLAGILAAYLAPCVVDPTSGWTPFDAAICAAHVHGRAGDRAAKSLGRRALIASDLLDHLGAAQRELER